MCHLQTQMQETWTIIHRIGKTEMAMKYIAYDHGIIGNRQLTMKNSKPRSARLQMKENINYRQMEKGEKPINLEREALEIKQHIHETPHQKADITCTITNKIGGKEGLKRQYKYQGTNLHPIWTTTTQSGNLIEQTNNEPTVKFWYC